MSEKCKLSLGFVTTALSASLTLRQSSFNDNRKPRLQSVHYLSQSRRAIQQARRTKGCPQTLIMVFTGIVEELGVVRSMENLDSADGGVTMTVECEKALEDARIGDSIAVNGTCLSITDLTSDSVRFGLVPETLQRTNLGQISTGHRVNLERSMGAKSRFGGHIVQGHVDCTGTVTEIRRDKDALWFTVRIPNRFMKYVVEKGYIAVDGASFTVCDVLDGSFTFTMIPITQDSVVTASKQPGDLVNIECDITGKYIERMMAYRDLSS